MSGNLESPDESLFSPNLKSPNRILIVNFSYKLFIKFIKIRLIDLTFYTDIDAFVKARKRHSAHNCDVKIMMLALVLTGL